jgi:UDP-N-acetylglucosamine--N-acetylmuramyl-(pentapeptide) pyrophosphoryl-undecaprenol N-acetylglucosamine transferase
MASIAFTGGGTGGHIYPGLAVVSYLKNLLPHRIFWIGSGSGMDRAIVESAGVEFFGIPSGKLRRYFSLRNFLDAFKIAAGFFAVRKILKREGASFLFSKGGFVSVPPCAAASLMKIPVFTHESDFSPGIATRLNTRFAERVFIPYKESAAFFTGAAAKKIRVSGNPVRDEFAAADPAKGRAFLGLGDSERILLILGGSLGSREINELVRTCLKRLTEFFTVVHQTGENNFGNIEDTLKENERYKPYAYFKDEIPHVIAAADLVLCRSGAGTIWECKFLRKPMVLIPFRGSGTRGDQVENARLFEEAGAAVCFIPDAEETVSAEKLSALIASLVQNPEKLKSMAEANICGLSEGNGANGANAADFIAREIAERVRRKDGQSSGD